MIDGYPDIEYDEQTRRINRRMKFLGGIIALLLAGGMIALIANVDVEPATRASLNNDTAGTVTCFAIYKANAFDEDKVELRETGRFEAQDQGSVVYGSICSVFDRDGNYVSCLRIRHRSGASDEQFLASGGERHVKANACVYPR